MHDSPYSHLPSPPEPSVDEPRQSWHPGCVMAAVVAVLLLVLVVVGAIAVSVGFFPPLQGDQP